MFLGQKKKKPTLYIYSIMMMIISIEKAWPRIGHMFFFPFNVSGYLFIISACSIMIIL